MTTTDVLSTSITVGQLARLLDDPALDREPPTTVLPVQGAAQGPRHRAGAGRSTNANWRGRRR